MTDPIKYVTKPPITDDPPLVRDPRTGDTLRGVREYTVVSGDDETMVVEVREYQQPDPEKEKR